MAQVNIDVAKEESVQAVNTKVGTSSDTASSTPTTLFAGIKGLIAWFTGTWTATRAEMVSTIGRYLDASSGSLQNTIHGKLNTLFDRTFYNGYGVSYWAYIASTKGAVKSVQRGYISTFTSSSDTHVISISTINPAKSLVILNGNHATTSNNWFPNINSLTNNNLTISFGGSWISSIVIKVSWQVIEFY